MNQIAMVEHVKDFHIDDNEYGDVWLCIWLKKKLNKSKTFH